MKNITAIIWDMDGVKYMANDIAHDAFSQASHKMALRHIPNITPEEAAALSAHSFKTYHTRYDFLFRDYGMDKDRAVAEFHDSVDDGFLAPVSSDYLELMRRSTIAHAILTQGSRKWAERVLGKLGILSLFNEKHITTIEEMGPHRKSDSVEPFMIALNKLNCAPENAAMVEDTQENLKFAKQLGMTTVLVHPREGFKQEAYTDHVFATPVAFLNALALMQNKNPSA